MGLISRVSSRTYRKIETTPPINMSTKQVVLKPASDSCMCDTIRTAVEAGITDLCLETEFRIKVDEIVKLDIPLNVECKCVGTNVKITSKGKGKGKGKGSSSSSSDSD